jgi:hypothetical protein
MPPANMAAMKAKAPGASAAPPETARLAVQPPAMPDANSVSAAPRRRTVAVDLVTLTARGQRSTALRVRRRSHEKARSKQCNCRPLSGTRSHRLSASPRIRVHAESVLGARTGMHDVPNGEQGACPSPSKALHSRDVRMSVVRPRYHVPAHEMRRRAADCAWSRRVVSGKSPKRLALSCLNHAVLGRPRLARPLRRGCAWFR